MICKVQCDSTGSEVLVYNEERTFMWWGRAAADGVEGEMAAGLITDLNLRPHSKCYLHVHVDAQRRLVVDGDAAWQPW
jgi:hypothetical protein